MEKFNEKKQPQHEPSFEKEPQGIVWVRLTVKEYSRLVDEIGKNGIWKDPTMSPFLNTVPHVTIGYDVKFSDFRQQYGASGIDKKIKVIGVAYNDQIAAALVYFDDNLLQSKNNHPHISLWGSSGVEPKESNSMLSSSGKKEIIFEQPIVLNGQLSFYNIDDHLEYTSTERHSICIKEKPMDLHGFAVELVSADIPYEASILINAFKKYGYSLLAVGGFPRDILLGKKPNDLDLVTDAPPYIKNAILNELGRYSFKGIAAQEVNGITTIVTKDGEEYEIATLRKEQGERKSNSVEFTQDLMTDLERRDFTVNTLAMNLTQNEDGLYEIYDGTGGIQDIKDLGVLKVYGDVTQKFLSDRSRMLRAIMMASRYNMSLSDDIIRFFEEDNQLVVENPQTGKKEGVSLESKKEQLFKGIVKSSDTIHYFKLLDEFGFLEQLLPELGFHYESIKPHNNPLFIVAAGLSEAWADKTDILKQKLTLLKFNGYEIDAITFFIDLKNLTPETAPLLKKRFESCKEQNIDGKSIKLTQDMVIDFAHYIGMSSEMTTAFITFLSEPKIDGNKIKTSLVEQFGLEHLKNNLKLIAETIYQKQVEQFNEVFINITKYPIGSL